MTTDRAAFIAAIRERPDDAAVRLIYADWLREQGEDASADYIEGQVEYARLGIRMKELRGCCCELPGLVRIVEERTCPWCKAFQWRQEWVRREAEVDTRPC